MGKVKTHLLRSNEDNAESVAARWQALGKLVQEFRAFDTSAESLNADQKAALRALIGQVTDSLPKTAERLREYSFDVATSALVSGNNPQAVVPMCERWKNKIKDIANAVAPIAPHYDKKLLESSRQSADVRDMHASMTEIRHFIESCSVDIERIEKHFPHLYKALGPYVLGTELISLRGAAIAVDGGMKKTDVELPATKRTEIDYPGTVKLFFANPFAGGLKNDALRKQIQNSASDVGSRKLLRLGLPQIAALKLLPSGENGHTPYTQSLLRALNEDIKEHYKGDAIAMAADNADAVWLDRLYEYRWARIARNVAKLVERHKEGFRTNETEQPATRAEAVVASKQSQGGFVGF